MIDAALLLLRSVTGGLLAGHGAQKLFGTFEGPGPEGTAGMMNHLGLEPPDMWARVAGASELAGGALTALGLGGPIGPVTALGPMAIATTVAHAGRPIWVTKGGPELPVTNAAAFGALALSGPGAYSADRLLGVRIPWWVGAATLAGVVGGTVAVHAMRRRPEPAPAEEPEVELRATPERDAVRAAGQAEPEPAQTRPHPAS